MLLLTPYMMWPAWCPPAANWQYTSGDVTACRTATAPAVLNSHCDCVQQLFLGPLLTHQCLKPLLFSPPFPPWQALPGNANKDLSSHRQGLQRLSNGEHVPYYATLRVVQHEGSRAPRVMSATTRKPPGYIRNESGGMFSS
jgi:hypothetical protein